MIQEILIGKGLSNISFGLTKDELIKLVGEPSEKDLYNASEEEGGYLTESWHYDDDEFSVSFDEEDGWKLTTISSSNPSITFNEKKLIGEGYNKVVEILSKVNLGSLEIDELPDNQKVITFIESSINFWFKNDNLSEIQWGVLWNDEDTPIWPS